MRDERLHELRQDLTKFQVRTLATIGAVGPSKGLVIKTELESFYGAEINHGRLYPNLDELGELGLVEIRREEPDLRSNNYEVTDTGREFLGETLGWLNRQYEQAIGPGSWEMELVADGGDADA